MKVAIKLRKESPIWNPYIEQLRNVVDTVVYMNGQLPDKCNEDILITTNLTDEELEKFENLKAVFLPKTGIDKLPVHILKERHILVTASHANADLIAEHALALALALLHRISEFHNDLTNNIWYSDGVNYFWNSIRSMPVGILGFGHVGKYLYQLLKPMNDDIVVLNRHKEYPHGICGMDSLEELLSRCKLVFICIPLDNTTKLMFSDERIHALKDKFVVNISRAGIFDEGLLYEMLKDHVIAGYASDVWFYEPDKNNKKVAVQPSIYPFSKLKNVILSPHCATHTKDAQSRYISDSIDKCLAYIRGIGE